jgi:Raf kinase inhibitor-like YbhB/YbcL family protein
MQPVEVGNPRLGLRTTGQDANRISIIKGVEMLPNRRPVSARLRLLAVVVVGAVGVITAQVKSAPRSHFVLSSPDARLAVRVPDEYTANVFGCTGGNVSPALQWNGAPEGTKSFVVTLFDPDVRDTGSGWWHWVVYDLPAIVNSLPKGAGVEHSSILPAGTQQGRTDLGNDAYHGPCPDKGQPPHHYTFTIYALSVAKLDVPPAASGAMVTSTAKENMLGKAVFIARYGR